VIILIINFIIWNVTCTGGIRVYFELINQLIKKGHKVNVVYAEGDYSWFPIKANMIKVLTHFKYGTWSNMIYSTFSLAKNIPEADVTVATWCFPAFPMFLNGKGEKFQFFLHYEPLFFNGLKKQFTILSIKLPSIKIVNSTWLQKILKEKHGIDSFLFHPGINHKIFKPIKVKKPKKKRIVCLGKDTVPAKGVQDALEAMKIVLRKRSDVELVFYGVSPLVTKTTVPYKFVKFPTDKQLAELYNSANIVLCPSWYESFPFPPLEAMATRTPVVTTRLGTEDYAFNEENCLVVEPRKPKEMAEAILRLLSDRYLQEQFRKEGIKTAKKFTWENSANTVERIFKTHI